MKDKAIKDAMNSIENRIRHVYNQGYEDGLKDGKESVQIDDSTAYERGLNDAWECARKMMLSDEDGGIALSDILKIFGMTQYSAIKRFSASESIAKIKEYEEKQKQEDDEIKIGDEIKNKWGTRGVVVEIAPQYNGTTVYSVLWRNAERRCLDKSDWDSYEVWKKTGRHFSQIEEVLEQMKGEEG